ncbi:uncharacterized protein LOC136071113 [Quercus suber]|uniref:uncharacterized protein LOC136071113 n=1 Tax=Quercus suber TaxID=58331 RepID=UPI0032E0577B
MLTMLTGPSIPTAPVRWTRPSDGLYKVNFDAALFEVSGCAGIGVAIRDSSGAIIGALSQKIALPHSVELAEALAARRAVVFAQELSIANVLVEGDCLKVVSALRDPAGCHTLYGHIVEDTHCLASQFQSYGFSHVRRRGNLLAHALARRAVSSADFDVWVEELPVELESIFQTDLI